jgi:hypothetical protein
MKFFSNLLIWSSLLAGMSVIAAPTNTSYDNSQSKAVKLNDMIHKYNRAMKDVLEKRGSNDKCNSKTVTIRKEW